ncbi:MAG: hypothetical protein L0170_12680, partial [Acidobacteria bacterium]|nr:hypothetical protein [Acidobacteriota bacterium]
MSNRRRFTKPELESPRRKRFPGWAYKTLYASGGGGGGGNGGNGGGSSGYNFEGYGSQTPGGSGGPTFYVTNLNDDGEGSFRYYVTPTVEAQANGVPYGPRIIKFLVGGVITNQRPCSIRGPFVTIDGSDAPDTVTINGDELRCAAHDVIMVHLRLRPRIVVEPRDGYNNLDCLTAGHPVEQVYNCVFYWLSCFWSSDEIVSVAHPLTHDITWGYCIFAEAIYDGEHPEGIHGMGPLIQGDPFTGAPKERNISFHHNLITTTDQRMPKIVGAYHIDMRCNVIYNWGVKPSQFDGLGTRINWVNNVYIQGPETDVRDALPNRRIVSAETITSGTYEMQIYAAGNGYLTGYSNPTTLLDPNDYNAQWNFIRTVEDTTLPLTHRESAPFETPTVTTEVAQTALELVLDGAGAVLPYRDAEDIRVIQNVRERGGLFVNTQPPPSEVAGINLSGNGLGRVLQPSWNLFLNSNTLKLNPDVVVPVRPDGFPSQLLSGQYAYTTILQGQGHYFKTGQFRLTWLGTGDANVEVAGDCTSWSRIGPNSGNANIASGVSGIEVRITSTDPNDPVHGMTLINDGFILSYNNNPFQIDFINNIQPFGVLRFAHWLRAKDPAGTPFTDIVEWADRCPDDYQTYCEFADGLLDPKGVPHGGPTQLGLRVNADVYVNVPHAASNDYVFRMARHYKTKFIDKTLGLRVWVELGHEGWNPKWRSGEYFATTQAYAQRAAIVSAIFREEFAAEGATRMVFVLSTDATDPGLTATMLSYTVTNSSGVLVPVSSQVDAVGINLQFGVGLGAADASYCKTLNTDQILAECHNEVRGTASWPGLSMRHFPNMITQQAAVTDNYVNDRGSQLFLIAYEAGSGLAASGAASSTDQILASKLIGANRASALTSVYTELFHLWKHGGVSGAASPSEVARNVLWYRDVELPGDTSSPGPWNPALGNKEYQTQEDTPRHDFCIGIALNEDRWWTGNGSNEQGEESLGLGLAGWSYYGAPYPRKNVFEFADSFRESDGSFTITFGIDGYPTNVIPAGKYCWAICCRQRDEYPAGNYHVTWDGTATV